MTPPAPRKRATARPTWSVGVDRGLDMQGADPLVGVTVVCPSTGRTFEAAIRRGTRHVELRPLLAQELPPMREGDALRLRRPVPGDATYEEPVRVTTVEDGRAWLEPAGSRRRRQQREHVRTTVQGATVRLEQVPSDDEEGATPAVHEARIVDVSAGGVRVVLDADVPCTPGSRWHAVAVLPGEDDVLELELVAEVRRTRPSDAHGPAAWGMRFVEVPRVVDQRITQWVFRQQARASHVGGAA